MSGKATRSDWAAQVPASGIVGLIDPSQLKGGGTGGVTDIGQLKAAGFANGYIPVWNGTKFIPRIYPVIPAPITPTDEFSIVDTPGVATRMLFGPGQNRTLREIFDIRQYGADPTGFNDSTGPTDAAISDLISNGGGCLYIPGGSYTFGSAPIDIPVPCLIQGDGAGVSVVNFLGAGFSGGDNGSWFGANDLSLITDGTATTALSLTDGTSSYMTDGTAIPLSDGTNVGDLFSFQNLQIAGFSTGISVNAGSRQGFISRCRIFSTSVGINLSCLGADVSDCIFINAGGVSSVAAIMGGDYHSVHGCRIFGGVSNWSDAIQVMSGGGHAIADIVIYGCNGSAINLSGATSARVQNISFGGIGGIAPIVFTPELHYVNELHGLGGNTNSSYDLRKELSASVTWAPGTLRILESATIDISVPGVDLIDQVAVGTPDATDFLQVSGRVIDDDTVRITVTNVSVNVITLPSAAYKIRAFN